MTEIVFEEILAGDMATVTRSMATVTEEQVADAYEVTDWTDALYVLRSHDFDQPEPHDGFGWDWQDHMMGDSVLTLRGEEHVERRKVVSFLIRSENLRRYEAQVLQPSLEDALAELASTNRGPDGVVRADLAVLAESILLTLMAEIVGLDGIAGNQENLEKFREQFRRMGTANRVRYTTADPEAVLRAGRAAHAEIMGDFFTPAWKRYEQMLKDVDAGRVDVEEVPDNLVTLMLRNRDHYDQWGPHVYGREVSLFIGASVGSTSTSVCNTFEEVEQWIDDHPEDSGKRLDEQFLLRALEEAVRLRGTVWLNRVAVADTTLRSGQAIRKGQFMWINLAACYPGVLGTDAFTFDPYREMPPRFPHPGGGFGNAPHVCLGKSLVMGEGLDEGERRGSALMLLTRLYQVGMRRDEGRERALGNSVRKKVTSCPVRFDGL